MFLFSLLLCLPLFPLFESKQFLAEMKSGKHKILETKYNGNGTGNGTQQDLSFHKNMAVKNLRKPDHKKVENAESTTESHLTTTTDKISKGEDYFLFGIVCFFIGCNSGKPSQNKPTQTNRPTNNPGSGNYGFFIY